MSKLYVIYGGQCEVIEIGLELTIGRSYANRLRLEGPDISRAHAIIYLRGEEYILRDLDSKNGVLVGDQRLIKHTLQPGDRITIGGYLLIFDPPESLDISQFTRKAADGDRKLRETDTNIHKRHQRYPLQAIRLSFHDDLDSGEFPIVRASSALRFAHALLTRLSDVNDTGKVCKEALDWSVETFAAHRGLIALCEREGDKPRAVAMFDVDMHREIKIHQKLLDWLFEGGEALLSVESDEGAKPASLEGMDYAHRIAMPLVVENQTRGFIYLENDPPAAPFTVDDLQRLYCISLVVSRKLEAAKAE